MMNNYVPHRNIWDEWQKYIETKERVKGYKTRKAAAENLNNQKVKK
jgi:hypothetical protein